MRTSTACRARCRHDWQADAPQELGEHADAEDADEPRERAQGYEARTARADEPQASAEERRSVMKSNSAHASHNLTYAHPDTNEVVTGVRLGSSEHTRLIQLGFEQCNTPRPAQPPQPPQDADRTARQPASPEQQPRESGGE
jgi:hypothetical protein